MDGAGDPPPRSERRRALRRPRRAHRRARSAGQRARLPAPGRGARRRRRGRRGARARRAPRPAARRAVHGQGGDPGGRDAVAQRVAPVRRPRRRRRCRCPLRRLRDAGAILLGKTNVPEFCAHWDTYNELFGATRNPARRHALGRRLLGRRSGGAGQRHDAARARLRLRRLDPLPRRTSAACSACGPDAARCPWADHHPMVNGPGPRLMASVGSDGALRRRPRAGARAAGAARAGGRCSDRRGGLRGRRPAAGGRGLPRGGEARGRRALADAGHDVVESRPPGQAEVRAAFDIVLVHEAASGMLPALERPRGGALGADPRDARGAARLRARRWRPTSTRSRGCWRLELEADAWLERHGAALCPVAPDVAPPAARELRSRGRRARAPGRQAHAVHATPARSACRRVAVPVARDAGRPPRRRPAHRPPRPRAGAAGAGARARGRPRRLAGPRRRRRPCSGT